LSTIQWLSADAACEWDAFVARHPLGLVYHLSAWQRVLETAFKHIRGRFLVLRDGGGQIQAGLPVYTVDSWLLGTRTVSVPYATVCDPLISSKEEFDLLWPAIAESAEKHRSRRVEIRTWRLAAHSLPRPLSRGRGFKHHYLPLGESADALFHRFDKSNIRRGVEKARREGVVVEERNDEESVRMFHAILGATRLRHSLPTMPLSFFQEMLRLMGPERASLYIAVHAGKPVGGLLALKFNNLWIAEYSGTTDNALRGISPLLYWEPIQRAGNSGATCFSFGRTSLDNTGLLEHKRRWATVEEDLTEFISCRDLNVTQGCVPLYARGVLAVARRFMRYTPAVIQKCVGDFCYRHLG
jgi:hypothetical protein